MQRKITIFLIILFIVSMVGCGTKPSEPASTATPEPGITSDTILIGANGSLTGPYAAYAGLNTTMEAYYKKVNDEGGINGRKIKFVYYDDAYDPSKTVGVMKRLVEEDKVFMVTGIGTGSIQAVADYLAENKVPVVPVISGSSKLQTYKNMFAMQPKNTAEGQTLAKYAVEKSGAKKVAVWYQNDDLGKEELEGIKAELKKSGLEPVAAIPFNLTDTDVSTAVMKFKEVNPDAVIMISNIKMTATFLKETAKLGLKSQYIICYGSTDLSVSTLAGAAAEGAVFTAYTPMLDDDTPKVKAHKEFISKYLPGKTANLITAYGQLSAEIVVEGLKRAGKDLTREKVLAALENMKNWDGSIVGNISYGPNQHSVGVESIYFVKIENGKFVKIN